MAQSILVGCMVVGSVDMKNRQKSQIKNREAKRRDQWAKKREKEVIDHERPLTYSLGELYKFNKSKGFITHRNPQIENMERRLFKCQQAGHHGE